MSEIFYLDEERRKRRGTQHASNNEPLSKTGDVIARIYRRLKGEDAPSDGIGTRIQTARQKQWTRYREDLQGVQFALTQVKNGRPPELPATLQRLLNTARFFQSASFITNEQRGQLEGDIKKLEEALENFKKQ